jgi:hypothetical protein
MLEFKKFTFARVVLIDTELLHMINKGQMKYFLGLWRTPAQQFHSLAA